MSEQRWLDELAALRSRGPLEFRPARIRWRLRRPFRWNFSLRSLATKGAFYPEELWVDVFDPAATADSRALVSVRVEPNNAINAVSQGSSALVAGRQEAGAAVVIRAGGHDFWPLYPAMAPLRPSRLGGEAGPSGDEA